MVFGVRQTKWTISPSLNNNNKSHATKSKEIATNSNKTSVVISEISVNKNNNDDDKINAKDDVLSGDYFAAFLMVLALGVRTAVLNI